MYIYVYIFIYIYTYIYAYICKSRDVSSFFVLEIRLLNWHKFVCLGDFPSLDVLCIYTYTYRFIYAHIYIYTGTNICIHIYTRTHVCITYFPWAICKIVWYAFVARIFWIGVWKETCVRLYRVA